MDAHRIRMKFKDRLKKMIKRPGAVKNSGGPKSDATAKRIGRYVATTPATAESALTSSSPSREDARSAVTRPIASIAKLTESDGKRTLKKGDVLLDTTHKVGSRMRTSLKNFESHARMDAMKLFLKDLHCQEAQALAEERRIVQEKDRAFDCERRKLMCAQMESIARSTGPLTTQLCHVVQDSLSDEILAYSEKIPTENIEGRLRSIREKKTNDIGTVFEKFRAEAVSHRDALEDLKKRHDSESGELYETFEKASEAFVEENGKKIVAIFGKDAGKSYASEEASRKIDRRSYREREGSFRETSLREMREFQTSAMQAAETRIRTTVVDFEKRFRDTTTILHLAQRIHLVDDAVAKKKEEIVAEEASFYRYLALTTAASQASATMEECDTAVADLASHIRASIVHELDGSATQIKRLRETCDAFVERRVAELNLDPIVSIHSISAHVEAFAAKMRADVKVKCSELASAFEGEVERIGVVFGEKPASLFLAQLRERIDTLRSWLERRLDTVTKSASAKEKTVHEELKRSTRRRMLLHLRDYRTRNESFARVVFLREKVSTLRAMHEFTEKEVLKEESKQEKSQIAQAVREASVLGELSASLMCKLLSVVQTSVVSETAATIEEVDTIRAERVRDVDALFQTMRAELKRRKGKLRSRAKVMYDVIKKKLRSHIAKDRETHTREAERICALFGSATAKEYSVMVQKAIEALLEWANAREVRVVKSLRVKTDATLNDSFDVVRKKMREEIESFEARCRRDAAELYASQARLTGELDVAHARTKFLEDESSYRQYLRSAIVDRESRDALNGAKIADRSEAIMFELGDFLQRSVAEETAAPIADLEIVRQKRSVEIEHRFEEFRSIIKDAKTANVRVETEAKKYVEKLHKDNEKRLQGLRESARELQRKMSAIFGPYAGKRLMTQRKSEIQKLRMWTVRREKSMRESAILKGDAFEKTALGVEKRMRLQIESMKKRARGDAKRILIADLLREQETMASEASRLLLVAEAAHLERLAQNATNEAANIADHNNEAMSDLTQMIQASLVEETKVGVSQIDAVRQKRNKKIEDRFAQIDRAVATRKSALEEEARVYADALRVEAKYRVETLEKKAVAVYDKVAALFDKDTAENFLRTSRKIATQQVRKKYEHEKDVLTLLHEVLKGCSVVRELRPPPLGE